MGDLGVAIHGQVVSEVKISNDPVGSQAAMGHPRQGETILCHKSRIPPRLIHVSGLELPRKFENVALVLLVNKRGVFSHGLFRIEHPRQGRVFDLDQINRLRSDLGIDRSHSCHLIPV